MLGEHGVVARCMEGAQISGRSKGVVRDVHPLVPNYFNFMQFLGKFGKIICWCPLLGSWCPHLGKILDLPLQMCIEWLLGVQRGTWNGLLGALKVCRGHIEGYRMVAMCTEGDMEWLLGVQRGHRVVAMCMEGAQRDTE